MTYHIFIGYDEREPTAYSVAKHTLEKYAKVPINVHKLCHRDLRKRGLFNREWKIEADGQYVDLCDGKPFSTQFSHSRFIIPELWKQLDDPDKSPLVMFVDCDFIWTDDIGKMFKDIEATVALKQAKALYCVKHNYTPTNTIKMDGMKQELYNKKLWSAMFVINMDYPVNRDWDFKYMVETETGRAMHGFDWLFPEEIGDISESWHYVAGHSETRLPKEYIKALHYTNGGPWFPHMRNCLHAEMWLDEYNDYLRRNMYNARFDVNKLLDGE
jgi:hypothetical protein